MGFRINSKYSQKSRIESVGADNDKHIDLAVSRRLDDGYMGLEYILILRIEDDTDQYVEIRATWGDLKSNSIASITNNSELSQYLLV